MQEDILYRKLTDRVATIFKDLRKQKGYNSYEAFAFDNEFPRAQYWRVENGRSNLTLRTIARLLALHNRTIDDFATFLSKGNALPGTQ
ncbi:helix-turn-helix domain-containing protein [Dawidia soli]|uniref:Helix-turn-helix domain-containing protein n=1 Tax=Dawidia soli TaxID=2782352 RepID=A0AAP2GJ24_9BACT|nr:helix-turn-helix transcriptional regulator [Dawidia soli]MBT1688040.1 helix-turn-helix domain-containing protein [Dawidia soli]